MDIWTPNLSDGNLYFETEDGNKYDKNAVAVKIGGKNGRDIPKNLSKTFNRFLTLRNYTIKCTVIRKCANLASVYGLEIPVNFKFLGPAKVSQWAENAVKKVIQNIEQRVKHCKK